MNYPTFRFENEFTSLDEFEMPLKGFRDDIIVNCPNKMSYKLCFYDVVRLAQELAIEQIIFHEAFVIVQEVNLDNIEKAINQMWDSDFFEKLKPVE